MGTEGKSLRLEGFWIQLNGDVPADAHIEYQVHVQNVGWMDPVQDGAFAGTEGKSQQIEAIKISLVDDEGVQLKDYSVVYTGHVQNKGDVGPYTNGEQLGTDGEFLRLEAITVEIVQNPADLTEYEAALAAVTQADYTAASWTAYQAVVNANVVDEDNLQSEVDAATAAIVAAQADLVKVLKVESVSAKNLKEVVVTFNNELDTATAQTIGNYTITNANPASPSVTPAGGAAVLSTDKKSVTIYLGTIAGQQQKFDFTVQNVKGTDGQIVAKTTKSIQAKDTEFPTVTNVVAIGSKTIEVTFSEAMNTVPTIKVKAGGVTYSGTPAFTTNNTKATLTIANTLPTGTLQAEISGGADYAGFAIDTVTKDFTVGPVTDAPTAQITDVKDKEITIKFNRPIKTNTFDGNANAYIRHTYNTTSNQTLGNDTTVGGANVTNPSNDNQTFVVGFANPLPPGTSTVYVGLVSATGTAIEDNYGNKFANSSYTVNLVADVTKPVVSTVEAIDASSVKVVFSKTVDATTGTNGAKNTSNYVLKDPSGNQIGITSVTDFASPADGVSFKLNTAANAIQGGNYTLEVKNVQDTAVAKNTLDTVTKTFTAADKVAPTVNTTGSVLGTKKIQIKFSEAMDVASITDANNYNVDSKVKFTAGSDAKSVVLDYTDVTTSAVDFTTGGPTTVVTVGRVKDASGNLTAAFQTSVTVTHGAAVIALKEANVTALDKTVVVVDDVLTVNAATAAFAVKVTSGAAPSATGGWAAATVASTEVVGNQTLITLTLPTPVAAADTALSAAGNKAVAVATGTVAGGNLTQAATAGVTNSYGAQLSVPMTLAKDKLAPQVLARETGDSNANGKIDQMTVTFSEALYAGSVVSSDFDVAGYVVKGIKSLNATSGVAVVELQEGIYDTAAVPVVKVIGSVEDVLGNGTTPDTVGTASTDKASPAVVNAAVTTNTATPATFGEITDVITMTYSEPVVLSFTAADATKTEWDAEFALTDSSATGALAVTTVMTSAGDTTNTITYEVKTAAFATPVTVANSIKLETKAGTKVKDAANNNQAVATGITVN